MVNCGVTALTHEPAGPHTVRIISSLAVLKNSLVNCPSAPIQGMAPLVVGLRPSPLKPRARSLLESAALSVLVLRRSRSRFLSTVSLKPFYHTRIHDILLVSHDLHVSVGVVVHLAAVSESDGGSRSRGSQAAHQEGCEVHFVVVVVCVCGCRVRIPDQRSRG